MELLQWVITVLSLVAAVLAWVAKIRWSKEYRAAKDEIIRSKDAMIEQLNERIQFYKDLTPMKLKEYFDSVKSQLEMQIEDLNIQKEKAAEEIKERNNKIIKLEEDKINNKNEIKTLWNEKQQLEIKAKILEQQSLELKEYKLKIPKDYYFPSLTPGIGLFYPQKSIFPLSDWLAANYQPNLTENEYKFENKESKEKNVQDDKN